MVPETSNRLVFPKTPDRELEVGTLKYCLLKAKEGCVVFRNGFKTDVLDLIAW
jgi:hypothetical protein